MKMLRIKFVLLQLLTLTLMFSVGCSSEMDTVVGNESKVALRLEVQGASGGEPMSVAIKTLRVIIFEHSENHVVLNQVFSEPINSNLVFKLSRGSYRICVVANETQGLAASLTSATRMSEIETLKIATPRVEGELVLYKSVDINIRPLASDPEQAEVSVDGSAWLTPSAVEIVLERVASKLSFSVRKNTVDPQDRFIIKRIDVINLPAEGTHLTSGNAYQGALTDETAYADPVGISVTDNNTSYSVVFKDLIVPYYQLANPSSSATAAMFVITASYTKAGEVAQDVEYVVPVTGMDAFDFSLARDTHYDVRATITSSGTLKGIFTALIVKDWLEEDLTVEDPEVPYLNVSDISKEKDLKNTGLLISGECYLTFWTNQPQEAIFVEEISCEVYDTKISSDPVEFIRYFPNSTCPLPEIDFFAGDEYTPNNGMIKVGLEITGDDVQAEFSKIVRQFYIRSGNLKRKVTIIFNNTGSPIT